MPEPTSDNPDRLRGVAYHEAGHVVMAYYRGCPLHGMSIDVDSRGEFGGASITRNHRFELEIAAAGRACAEAFGFPQTSLDTAQDDFVISQRLSESLNDPETDDEFDLEERRLRAKVSEFFQRDDARAAVRALAEQLYAVRQIESGVSIEQMIAPHLKRDQPNG